MLNYQIFEMWDSIMKDGNGRLKSFTNILDNIIIIVLKYCKDKFILKGEVYESYKFIQNRFC